MGEIQFQCTACGTTLAVDDRAVGRTVTCPECSARLRVPATSSPPQPPLPPPGAPAPAPPMQQYMRCPFCREEILVGAVKCKHCGEFLDATRAPSYARSNEPEDLTAGEWIVAILCPCIGLIMGTVWAIQGKKKAKKMLVVSFVVWLVWVFFGMMAEIAEQPR